MSNSNDNDGLIFIVFTLGAGILGLAIGGPVAGSIALGVAFWCFAIGYNIGSNNRKK